jgi:dTDP-4-amino-4,6-dideoxygalactose transaminase
MVMHYGGYLVDLPAWRAFADSHELRLIEDAAHAPATAQVGRLSDAAAFSFFTNKNMTTTEGGMVVCPESSMLERVRLMRSHGMTTNTLERYRGHAGSYDVTMLGYNYRMDELRAAMGLVQLTRLPEWNERRRELAACYRENLGSTMPEVSVPFDSTWDTAAHLMPVLLPDGADREKVMMKLRQNGVQSSIHYPPVHGFSYYQDVFPGVSLPMTEQFGARELTLPLHPGMHENDVEHVVHILSEAL